MHLFMRFLVVPNWRFTAIDSDTDYILPIGLVSPPYLSQISFEQLAIPLGGYTMVHFANSNQRFPYLLIVFLVLRSIGRYPVGMDVYNTTIPSPPVLQYIPPTDIFPCLVFHGILSVYVTQVAQH